MTGLVIGASGQVGALLYQYWADKGTCVGTYCHHGQPGLCRLDLRDHAEVRKILQELRPEVCYVPGGLTFVDYAENHPEECRDINVLGVANLAEGLATLGSTLVLFSTDHVFGNPPVADASGPAHPGSPRPRREDEAVEPLSAYAKSKAHAEQLVRQILPEKHLILRTSWVFGPDPQQKNFVYRLLQTLKKGEPLLVPSDQHGQPTFGPDLARTALRLVTGGATGTFHVVGPEYLSRLSWAQMIAATLGLPANLIQGRPTAALPPQAKRPLHVRLARQKLLDQLGRDPIRSPRQGLEEMKRELKSRL
jgi:dTDP-4-dehydrorhamnose reductase